MIKKLYHFKPVGYFADSENRTAVKEKDPQRDRQAMNKVGRRIVPARWGRMIR